MVKDYLEVLIKLRDTRITSSEQLTIAKNKASNIIRRIFGTDSSQEKQLENIEFRTYLSYGTGSSRNRPAKRGGGGDNLDRCIVIFTGLIDSIIEELENFGPPIVLPDSNDNNININLNQSINISLVIQMFRNELTGNQYDELKEILDDNRSDQDKKQKVLTKLKEFGNDVMSNILANILSSGGFM